MTEVSEVRSTDSVTIVEKDINGSEVSSPRKNSKHEPPKVGEYEAISGPIGYNSFPNDPEFAVLVRDVEVALDSGIKPQLSPKGTSGCYFVKDKHEVTMWEAELVLMC
ncbi:phosphatidylinositol 4-kinase type 2-beta [Plakobranchus ocellatus]|uniref:Phosphatidylinositol 4-kinase type 2-beta n=1 Tax=Plakobranchus ocellatus TaxID=259542 RepID=A0AAV4A316_9GAST|nr:phosphatidylinositol 4-kinase type 2-beta [Plakobranchus ocellatus]